MVLLFFTDFASTVCIARKVAGPLRCIFIMFWSVAFVSHGRWIRLTAPNIFVFIHPSYFCLPIRYRVYELFLFDFVILASGFGMEVAFCLLSIELSWKNLRERGQGQLQLAMA